uniref:Collagen alpha chain CG42342-like n=1 Tax=Drosophila rhopaloa TaxID=1041015 RepID=A0A6P4ECE4_DRORH
MRKHKAPPSSSPRTMPQDISQSEPLGLESGSGAGGESQSPAAVETPQQSLLLGHNPADSSAAATAAAAASRLAPPPCQPPISSSIGAKERPRPTVRFLSLLHVASYVLCLCAFSFALYGNVRQTRLEQRMQRLQQLDARIVELELRLEQQQLLHWPADQTQILASTPSDSGSNNGSQHLALHVRRELHRLRRDVSHLQLTRRQQRRQAAEAAAAAASGEGGSGGGQCQCQA